MLSIGAWDGHMYKMHGATDEDFINIENICGRKEKVCNKKQQFTLL